MSRSAYKLEQLAFKYPFLQPGRVIVDLGAAPGGWSQAILHQCPDVRLFSLDILPLSFSSPRVTFVHGDFTGPRVREQLSQRILQDTCSVDTKVDVVLSDMMGVLSNSYIKIANTSGHRIRDAQASLDLCSSAFVCCPWLMNRSFVDKCFDLRRRYKTQPKMLEHRLSSSASIT